jgi:hypothetical protein
MTDPRVAKLADLLVNYSLQLTRARRAAGWWTVATLFIRELYREALAPPSAHPRRSTGSTSSHRSSLTSS